MSDEIISIETDPRGRSPMFDYYRRWVEQQIYEILLPSLSLHEGQKLGVPRVYFGERPCVALTRIENQCRALVGPVRK